MPQTGPRALPDFLEQFGVTRTLQKIKFGGVVGKQTLLGVFVALMLASIAWRADPDDLLILAALGVGVVGLIAVLNFIYANKHPLEAMLEGSEIIAFQQQTLAAKSMLNPPPAAPVIPRPDSAAPKLQAVPPEQSAS